MKGKSIAVEEVPASKTPSDPPESKETGYELPDLAEQRMLLFNMPTGISKKEMLTTFAYVDGSYSLPDRGRSSRVYPFLEGKLNERGSITFKSKEDALAAVLKFDYSVHYGRIVRACLASQNLTTKTLDSVNNLAMYGEPKAASSSTAQPKPTAAAGKTKVAPAHCPPSKANTPASSTPPTAPSSRTWPNLSRTKAAAAPSKPAPVQSSPAAQPPKARNKARPERTTSPPTPHTSAPVTKPKAQEAFNPRNPFGETKSAKELAGETKKKILKDRHYQRVWKSFEDSVRLESDTAWGALIDGTLEVGEVDQLLCQYMRNRVNQTELKKVSFCLNLCQCFSFFFCFRLVRL